MPKKLVEDSMFPFPLGEESEAYVKISFKVDGDKELLIEKWTEASEEK